MMQKIVDYFLGTCRVTLSGPWPIRSVNRMVSEGIPFWDLRSIDAQVSFVIHRRSLRAVENLCEQDATVIKSKTFGFRHKYRGLKKRYALLLLPLFAVLTIFLQQFIWTMEVQGNERLAAEQILQALESIGIHQGTYVRTIDGQMVKNHMLRMLPELEWISVNKKGGRAVVLVKEREEKPDVRDPHLVSNVIAARAGVVTEMQVYAGFPVVEVGDSVLKGEMLVSGLGSSWNAIVCRNADAEVFAYTQHVTELILPEESILMESTPEQKTGWSLIFGKKRWNFFSDDGISLTGYDKIESVYQWTLPGGIKFPVSLVKTTCRRYDTLVHKMPEEQAQQLLLDAEQAYVTRSLGAGKILNRSFSLQCRDGIWQLRVVSDANEMIAQIQQINPWSDEVFE
ncbi:MAG: hypothetical protein E7449_00355 [Ruminococcaceae bacterium]|nr:hypothetical protein [Oscillospiraceae bacterium]